MIEDKVIKNIISDHIKVIDDLSSFYLEEISSACQKIIKVIKNGGTIFFCGNGGSAADCQHLAAEFVGRFELERKPLKAVALTVDSSALTCISNDYDFDNVFSRQLEALGNPKDLLVAISTSGNSKNIINCLNKAKNMNIRTIALLGKDGGEAKDLAELKLIVPSVSTARIQEAHILLGHIFCLAIDKEFLR